MPRTANSNRNRGDTKAQSRRHYLKNIEVKRFHCSICEKTLVNKFRLEKHFETKRHILNFIYC